MSKYVLLIILIILNIIGFNYLFYLNDNLQSFEVVIHDIPVLINKKEISLYSTDDFVFEEYFEVIGNDRYSYDYSFDEDNINLYIYSDDFRQSYAYPYLILEVPIVTEVIYETVYIETSSSQIINESPPISSFSEPSVSLPEVHIPENNKPAESSFTVTNSSLSYPLNTDMGTILSGISSSFVSDCYVSVDYAELNPSVPGTNNVYLYSQDGNSGVIGVNIQ
ncbi:MAG: hypothetical protein Q4D13_00275 [Erysipelotrichaceae bacterium]|nr:hypothetical protein [Erysipelotrichaceae bacterium]